MGDVINFNRNLETLEKKLIISNDGTEPPMEARIARLEVAVDYIQRDVGEIKSDIREIRKDLRWDFIFLATLTILSVLGLAGIMAKGFHWL